MQAPAAALPGWCARFIGRPYRLGGRGPAAWDCWGLVLAVLRDHFGLPVPDYGADTPDDSADHAAMARLALAGAGDGWHRLLSRSDLRTALSWPPSGPEQPGDVVLMRRGLYPCHVGIVVAADWMIHAQDGIGTAAERLRHGAERNNILSLYRHPELI